jgi:hypothetical protein
VRQTRVNPAKDMSVRAFTRHHGFVNQKGGVNRPDDGMNRLSWRRRFLPNLHCSRATRLLR